MAKKHQLTTSDYLPYTEYQRLLQCLHNDKEYLWEMYACLSFCTACRVSDVLNLRWCDVLNKHKVVVTEKKTKKTRYITFNSSSQQKFNELYILLGCPEKRDYIFPIYRGEGHMTVQHVNRKLKDFKYKYKLQIGQFSTHTFRKTFGRYVYESQNRSAESLILLNQILRHTSIETTKVYLGITQDEINAVFDSIQF